MLKIIENSNCKISRNGNVFNPKGVELKQQTNHKGYKTVHVNYFSGRKTCSVHRLVALAFIPNPENKPQVNHIDGDKTNNCVDNLEWVTQTENMRHATDILGHYRGEKAPTAILTEQDVIEIMKLLQDGKRNEDIAPLYSVGAHVIKQIRRGVSWRHITKGVIFQKGNRIPDNLYIKIKQMKSCGCKIKEIMEETKLSKSTVTKITGGKHKRPELDAMLYSSETIENTEQSSGSE